MIMMLIHVQKMRHEYFSAVIEYLNTSPVDFPEPLNRKKRKIEILMPAPPDPPKEPAVMSKADLKAQGSRDRNFLNLLKLRIQPIMDQIRMKFKKFRTGVIDESHIRYLYDEDDPAMVSTDLPPEQRGEDQHRPFEKGLNHHGAPGLVETATGKFFFNLEIVTIEKRLSNGYYMRPQDFLSDIKKLTKDAKAIGDQERLLKARELQANVEVDMEGIATADPVLCAELEAFYERETKREKEMIEKAKAKELAATEGQRLEMVPSNVPSGIAGLITEQPSGPIISGQPVTNGVVPHPVTPSNPSQPSQRSILTNGPSGVLSDLSDLQGHINESNGNSVPSRSQTDPQITSEGPSERETQNSSFGPSAQTQLPFSYTGGPINLQQRMSVHGSLSQRSAITPMAEGSNPHDYTNYASTTSSEKQVRGSSGLYNTPSFHAKPEGADLGADLDELPEIAVSNSQMPDTQGTASSHEYRISRNMHTPSASQNTSNPNSSQSQNSSQPSQNPAVPPFPRPSNPHASIHSLLNNDAPPITSTAVSNLVIDPKLTDQFLDEIVAQSSGCSVEQLEQIYSALMDKLWKTRGDWNRARVTRELMGVFNDVLGEIKAIQEIAPVSLEIEG